MGWVHRVPAPIAAVPIPFARGPVPFAAVPVRIAAVPGPITAVPVPFVRVPSPIAGRAARFAAYLLPSPADPTPFAASAIAEGRRSRRRTRGGFGPLRTHCNCLDIGSDIEGPAAESDRSRFASCYASLAGETSRRLSQRLDLLRGRPTEAG